MNRKPLTLSLLEETLAVCRLAPDADLPEWAWKAGALVSLTRTADELSIVCPQAHLPAGVRAERGFRAFKIMGPLDFALTGVLSGLLLPLAAVDVSVFTLSTYDTDYLMVREAQLDRAREALSRVCRLAEL